MAESHDTEITLGTGKVLFLFFGLVALCAAFFGMGFKMGKNSSAPVVSSDATSATTVAGGARPSAVKPSTGAGSAASADLALYKSASQNSEDAPAMGSNPAGANASDSTSAPDPTAAPAVGGYYVQVAAVSRPEDGDALVDALKRKQYAASSVVGSDKLYHVQVGPFADVKNAEDTRARLMNDGYNPILKK